MVYAIAWNEAAPVGASVDAATLDTELQDLKKSIRERMNDILSNEWETDADNPKLLASPDAQRARVSKTGAQTISNNTLTVLTWDTENYDVGDLHDNATNNSRITVPTGGAGVWLFGTSVRWAANTTGHRRAELNKNGAVATHIDLIQTVNSGSIVTQQIVTFPPEVVADADYFTISVSQSSGGDLDVGVGESVFWALRLA